MSTIPLLPELTRMQVEFGFREEIETEQEQEQEQETKSENLLIRIGNDLGDLQLRRVRSNPARAGLVIVELNKVSPLPSKLPLIIDTGRTAQLNNSYELEIDTILYENNQEVDRRERRNTSVKVTSGGGGPINHAK